nr:unnamed protein product [Callosobruchus analis]
MDRSGQVGISEEQEIISTHENTGISNHNHNELSLDLEAYLNLPTIPLENNPIIFWSKSNASDLATLAKRYLSIVGSSDPSERIFSQAGNILTQIRNRLNGKYLSQLLFLHLLDSSYWFE